MISRERGNRVSFCGNMGHGASFGALWNVPYFVRRSDFVYTPDLYFIGYFIDDDDNLVESYVIRCDDCLSDWRAFHIIFGL